MTGCVALRKDVYYVRLTYYDREHKRKDKWVSTGLSGRGAKQKATAMIESLIEKYKYLEKNDHPTKMADYLLMWKNLRKSEGAETSLNCEMDEATLRLLNLKKDFPCISAFARAFYLLNYVE